MADSQQDPAARATRRGEGVPPVLDSDFDRVVRAEELQAIAARRQLLADGSRDAVLPGAWDNPPQNDLVGLALSGGGIRSATFNLGVLQRLAELKVLPLVDYLSTVSGGGFIGGWWSSWMHRLAGNSRKWLPAAAPGRPFEEPSEVEHLRLYSNYLIPRKGFFSPDTWRAITVVLRNLFVTQIMVASLLATLFLLVDWLYVRMMPDSGMLILDSTGAPAAVRFAAVWQWPLVGVVVAWIAFTIVFLLVASGDSAGRQKWRTRITQAHARFAGTVFVLAALFALAGFSDRLVLFLNLKLSGKIQEMGGWLAVLPGLASAVFTAFVKAPLGGGDTSQPKLSGPTSLVMKLAPALSLLTLSVLLGAGAWRLLRETYHYMNSAAAPPQPGWIFITSLVVVFGVSQLYFLRALHTRRMFSKGLAWRTRLAERDPQDLGILAIALLSFAAGFYLYSTYGQHTSADWVCLACFLVVAQLAIGVGFATDPNALSLHNFYKARLVRAYLGATNQARLDDLRASVEVVSRPKDHDDLPLCDLQAWLRGGPLHILNTTLNLVGAQDLTSEQRQAEVFELSPLFCGSRSSGYRPTEQYADGRLTLGTAVAVSGAAASTNMGSNTSVPMAMLMSFFNVRLGFWIANPARQSWRYPWTRFWLWYMLREMLAQTTSQGKFSFLSDGGHLENLGFYSLVKRRCRYIIVCDAAADPGFQFGDLANAIRMARIDFGCEVDIDLSALRPIPATDGPYRRGEMHYAVGAIHFPDGSPSSTLLYLKSSLTKNLPADVQGYAQHNPAFPHQSTADQFFDEAQFESYRRLGAHIADAAFGVLQSHAGRNFSRDSLFTLLRETFESRARRAPARRAAP